MDTINLSLHKAIAAGAPLWRDVPFTREAWGAEFPADAVDTPLGPINVSPALVKSYATDAGLSLLGALRPCLEAPAFVLTPGGVAGPVEFYRAFTAPSGLLGGYVCARVDGDEVSLFASDELPPAVLRDAWTALDAEPGDSPDAVVFKSLFAPGVLLTDFDMAVAALGVDPLAKSDIPMDVVRAPGEPTEAQAKAGNYRKRRMTWNGLPLAIENEAGSVRRGTDAGGRAWETRMVYPYGYVLGSVGADGDQVDVFVGPDESAPMVYVVHQRQRGNWSAYDEDKCMLGFASEEEAVQAFLLHYDDPRILGPVTAMPLDEFCRKVRVVRGEMLKAHGPIPAGARWITVHPHGDGSKGVPVLVQEEKHGSGVFRVIGGAGGKLNYLKLRGVKSEGEYRQDAAEKAKAKREEKKARVEADKAAGVHEAKEAARKDVNEQKRQAEREFIQTVADAMGWDLDKMTSAEGDKVVTGDKPDDKQVTSDNLSPEAQKKAEKDRHALLLQKARDAVKLQRVKLANDSDARAAAGLGELPLTAGPDAMSVEDLNPINLPDGSGISHAFGARAKANGLTAEKLKAMSDAVTVADSGALVAQVKAAAAVEKGEAAKAIAEELANLPKPELKAKVADAKKAVAMIAAEKKLKALQKAAREANRELDASHVEPKAYVLSVSAPTLDDVAKDVDEEIRTAAAASLLAEVREAGGDESLAGHVFSGAHAAINAVSLAVAGASLLDRSAVDVLGVAGAAQVLARRLHGALAPERVHEILGALEKAHAETQADRVKAAMSEAKALQESAAEIEVGEAANASDLSAAVELSRQRKQYLADSRKVLGQALGELEAGAALVQALGEGARQNVQLSLGKTTPESAIRQLYALGLEAEDFQIDRTAGNVFVNVLSSGMDKLAAAPDAENLSRVSRNLAIQRGEFDEDNWLPQGFADRPDLALNLPAGVAQKLAEPMDFAGGDLSSSLRDYIGGRFADGDAPADILADVQSAAFFDKAGDKDAYRKALDAVVPLKDENGKMARVESLAPVFDKYADDYVASRWGGKRSTLNRQTFEADDVAQDALHRALADEPAGTAAYKPVADLTLQDSRALRDWFAANVAHETPEEAEHRAKVEKLAAEEPPRVAVDMFGDETETPEWKAWRAEFDQAKADHAAARLDWPTYCKAMRGRTKALEAIQDCVRSKVSEGFAKHYNTLRPGAPLKVGKTVVRGNLNHLGAVDPAAREKRVKEERALIDSLRERIKGKYASGSVAEKLDAAAEEKAAFNQAQMSFFGAEELPDDGKPAALGADERHTIGQAAEAKIGAMMQVVGRNFEAGKPVKLFRPTMSGPEGAKRQRAIKLVEANKRVILGAGVGSGKTGMGLGAFAHLHSQGKVKKGLFVVPSIVQGQFGAEALRFLKPGQFDWHCEPGASYEDRLAAYKNPGKHFAVVTHQSFRDDLLRMASDAGHGSPAEVADKLAGMTKGERAEFTKGVLAHHGVGFDYVMADEAHGLLNREGKENSRLSNVVEGVTDLADYYVHASGDPVKNDASEAFSLLQKMDGARYSDRDAFMRRYGGDTMAAREGLQRELARHLYAMQISPDVAVTRKEVSVPLAEGQNAALGEIDKHAAALRIAKMEGRADVDAARALAPAMFEGVDEADHDAVARRVADSVGILKDSATRRVLNTHPESGKLDAVAQHAAERKGKQGVIFARNLDAVESIRKRLEAEGHRVVTITGKDSARDKGDKIRAFNPDKGDPEADIVVCSDAGATGANLQSGQWLLQYDTPDTAMTHAQRQGRINRIGQKNAVELIDLIADHESERRARSRLANKYGLRQMMTSPLEALDDTGLGAYLNKTGHGAPVADSLF